MADSIAYRGPDDSGVWTDESIGLALGHRRLSVLDLSCAGHQPMTSSDGRYVVVLNGEIYNHLDLRTLLTREDRHLAGAGSSGGWRGSSDTETLLACFSAWGVDRTLSATVGMFAIALWDRGERILTVARDRLGEKPLYYGWQRGTLLFGSEVKALEAHPEFDHEIDRDSLTSFLRHNYIPAPYSIYRNISKLLPGHFLSIQLGAGEAAARAAIPQPYWRLNDVVRMGLSDPFSGSDSEAVELLESKLKKSILGQMLSDVPLGAFLSGGVDSSTVVALMQAQSRQPVRTFTIGFGESGYNEAEHAKAVARHLGTQHTEVFLGPREALDLIPKLPCIYSEPFADSSQIPTFLLSRITREHVTVALSGDAGDELLGGYNRYLLARQMWSKMTRLPAPARRAAATFLRMLSPSAWDAVIGVARPLLPKRLQFARPGDQAHKLADVLGLTNGEAFYRQLVSQWPNPSQVVIGGKEPTTLLEDRSSWPQTDGLEHWMMAMDTLTYLPDDILTKVDRAAMANSLETRVPFLDHRVVEFAWQLPLKMKFRNAQGKWILREVLNRYVPSNLVDRPKMGFGVPLDVWLRGPLLDWAEHQLDERRLKNEGYFHAAAIRDTWAEHLSGRRNWQHRLWPVLMFQAWLEQRQAG
jgi:asparagine synthase (glutamine-hydrolysing)